MNVLAPNERIIKAKIVALLSAYIRSSDGVTMGGRTGPDGIWYMPCSTVTFRRLGRVPQSGADCQNRRTTRDRTGGRPSEREPERGGGEQCESQPERAHHAEHRGTQMRAHAKHRLAVPMVLDQRPGVDPGPPPDWNAQIAIVRPPFIDLDGPDGDPR
jgi:hypothetical protein